MSTTPLPSAEAPGSPSPRDALLPLIAASIVRDHDPTWLPTPVATLADWSAVSAERVSRLKGRILPILEEALEKATRPGRPESATGSRQHAAREEQVAEREELLRVAAGALEEVGIRGRPLQDRLVAAYAELSLRFGTSVSAFTARLGLSERTFRHWRRRAAAPLATPPPTPSPPKPKRYGPGEQGRGRFDPARTLPGIQAMADTTQTQVLGVPLKLIGVQDPGGRDRNLLAEFLLSPTETGELVAKTVDRLRELLPGRQFVTDQGTPYMAQVVQELCEVREVEHAPAPEGTPTAKATLERAFGTLKTALAPILELTQKAAEAIPVLCDESLAVSLATLLFGTGLRIYRFASKERPGVSLPPADRETLEAVAQEQREAARSEQRSRRLLLAEIHREYGMPDSQEAFVRRFRDRHIEDLRAARLALANAHCCCRIAKPDRYFAAILWRVSSENLPRRSQRRREVLARAEERSQRLEVERERAHRDAHPGDAVLVALDLLAAQYRAERDDFAAGRAFGLAPLRLALRQLLATTSLPDEALAAAWHRWRRLREPSEGCAAKVHRVFTSVVDEVRASAPPQPPEPASLAELARTRPR